MRTAVVRDGFVENIIIAAENFDPGDGSIIVEIGDQTISIGSTYDGVTFTPPAPPPLPVPQSVAPNLMRKALRRGGLIDTIEAYVATLTPDEQDDWEYAPAYYRDNPVIEAGRQALNLTESQIDDLFRLAASL